MKGYCANISMVFMIMFNIVGQMPMEENAAEMLKLLPKAIFLTCEDGPQFFSQM